MPFWPWASCQTRKIAGCSCVGNAGNVFSATEFKGNRRLATLVCITPRAWRTYRHACRDRWPAVTGKTFPAMTDVMVSLRMSVDMLLHGTAITRSDMWVSLQWRHNGPYGVSNRQPHDCLLIRLFGRRSKKTSKYHVTGLCGGNSPVTGEFFTQRASSAANISIWWRHDMQNDSDESSMRRHDMETFSPLLALCEGNPPVMRPLVFSLILSREIPIKDAIALILRHCNAPDLDRIGRHALHRVPVKYFHSW